jgi:hypothetical protein
VPRSSHLPPSLCPAGVMSRLVPSLGLLGAPVLSSREGTTAGCRTAAVPFAWIALGSADAHKTPARDDRWASGKQGARYRIEARAAVLADPLRPLLAHECGSAGIGGVDGVAGGA